MKAAVPIDRLKCRCDPKVLGCTSSMDVAPLQTIIGQVKALKALQFGLDIKEKGFNIYVSGLPGTGKKTAVSRYLEEITRDKPTPADWCYVNNFQDSYHPRAISLPAGRAINLKKEVAIFVEAARSEIKKAFESEEYALKRNNAVKAIQQQRDQLVSKTNEQAQKQGFIIQATPMGLVTVPIKDNKPLTEEEFRLLETKKRDAISKKQKRLNEKLKKVGRQMITIEKKSRKVIEDLDRAIASNTLDLLLDDLREDFHDIKDVLRYLSEMQNDMLDNLAMFRLDEHGDEKPMNMPQGEDVRFRKYRVNVLVNNSDMEGVPIVLEMNPTYNNLFGRIEKEAMMGALFTDFTMIREGSVHKANGGYLILPVEDVLRNIMSWDGLKRSIRNQEILIEEAGERLGFMTTRGLMPEPIPWDIKVILIGDPYLYFRLYDLDPDFRDLFKVKADFDMVMERTNENMKSYASFVCNLCEEEKLRHFDKHAIAKVVEHSCRLAADQEKLSTRFGEIADVVREASFYAGQNKAKLVKAQHVNQAIEERFDRSSLMMEKTKEMIGNGTIKIDVEGEQTGQVNGLSVIDLGDIMFGRPSRITASIGLGGEGLMDIEREAKLGGPIHTKGVMILAGYLMNRYAGDKPLSLSARLAFEQSYSGVEGDSASSTELYALLSALSGIPINQGIAVTGSVNQNGEVQAIGGVNAKIEGFYEVCKVKGFTSGQGVMIPASNVRNLMLKDEVIEAVEQGTFHIWSVETIDDGIEILTGKKAGRRKKDGTYTAGSINDLVDSRLRSLTEKWMEFSQGKPEKKAPARRKKK